MQALKGLGAIYMQNSGALHRFDAAPGVQLARAFISSGTSQLMTLRRFS